MQERSLILDVPKYSRPRERLEEYGEKALGTHELLAILLRTGSKDNNVLAVAMELLNSFGDLHRLKLSSLEELREIKGIGHAKSIEIRAAIEFGVRIASASQLKIGQITSSQMVGDLLFTEMKDLPQEHVVALYLNTKNHLIKKETIFVGGLNSSIAHPREIFRGAVRVSAARIILGHNHPSGNPEPSQADISFTKRIIECGELMGIDLLDHIVVGEKGYVSLKEIGII